MGLFNFLRDVGAKLSGHDGAYSAPTPEALEAELKRLGLPADGLSMQVEGDTVHLSGQVRDAETREKIVLAVGNVEGVGKVDDGGLQGGETTGSLAGAVASMSRLPAGAAGTQAAAAPSTPLLRNRWSRGRAAPCSTRFRRATPCPRSPSSTTATPTRTRPSSRRTARCSPNRIASTRARSCASRRAEPARSWNPARSVGQPTKRTGPG